MSDFWNRCRRVLRGQMATGEWQLYIQPLRGWMDAGRLYLWVNPDRHHDRARAELLEHVRHEHDASIRNAGNSVSEGRLVSIAYSNRPPNQERIITDRRTREHLESERKRDREGQKMFPKLVLDELAKLLANGSLDPARRYDERDLIQLAQNAALLRLEGELSSRSVWRATRVRERGAPPLNAPLWPPPLDK